MINGKEETFWLSEEQIATLLSYFGIYQAEIVFAGTASEAKSTAAGLGFPVAVKLASSTITHKTDVGGVILDVNSESEVEKAYNTIKKNLEKLGRDQEMLGVSVQKMITEGVETIVGVTQDPAFGPLIMLGSGGIYAELLKDVTLKLHPITDLDADEMIHSLKLTKLLNGYRGSPPCDVKELQDLLLRVSAMVETVPEIGELDLNPVNVMPDGQGYRIIDARIMLHTTIV